MRFLSIAADEDVPEAGRIARIRSSVVWFVRESDYQFTEVLVVLVNVAWIVALIPSGDYLEELPPLAALSRVVGEPWLLSVSFAMLVLPTVAIWTGARRFRRAALLTYAGYYGSLLAGVSAISPTAFTAGVSLVDLAAAGWGFWRLGGRLR
ncbi:MAG: hypothetical protein IT336_15100 [Thermomicrobiales bacterium]|nr:hypothetical protein [Thermomicrobiales bacterium]